MRFRALSTVISITLCCSTALESIYEHLQTNPVPSPVSILNTVPTSHPAPSPFRNLICQFGGYCKADSDCVPGNQCNVQSQYYSQCIADSSTYRSSSTGCISNYGSSCNAASDCCDPGAICSNRQCLQPTAPNCIHPPGFGGSSPTSNPAPTPPPV